MRGSLGGRATLSPDRLVSYLAWVRAICSLRFGWYRAAADRALFWFARRYQGQPRASREELVNVLCKTFDEALSAGRQGERMQLRQWIDMSGKPDSSHRSFEAAHAVMALK